MFYWSALKVGLPLNYGYILKEISKGIGEHGPPLAVWKSTKSLISSVAKTYIQIEGDGNYLFREINFTAFFIVDL